MTPSFTLNLECGHEAQWNEMPGDGGAPYSGLAVYCHQCQEDRAIEDCEPRQFNVKTITLTDNEPSRSPSPYGGYTAGSQATIFYDTGDGTYGYCFHGVGDSGLYGESDDVTGFASAAEAEDAAIGDWHESESETH